jgi:hypothetical protein
MAVLVSIPTIKTLLAPSIENKIRSAIFKANVPVLIVVVLGTLPVTDERLIAIEVFAKYLVL